MLIILWKEEQMRITIKWSDVTTLKALILPLLQLFSKELSKLNISIQLTA